MEFFQTSQHGSVPSPYAFTSSVAVIPSTSGTLSNKEKEPENLLHDVQDGEKEDSDDNVSVSESESSSNEEKDSEIDEPDIGETQSAVSKVSNRSSPSVLSMYIDQPSV